MYKLRVNRGFSLVELLVVVLIMGFVGLFITQMTSDNMKAQNTVKTNSVLDNNFYLLDLFLSKPEACLSSLGMGTGATITPLTYTPAADTVLQKIYLPKDDPASAVAGVYAAGDTAFFETGVKVPEGSAEMGSIKLLSTTIPQVPVSGQPTQFEYYTFLNFEINKNAQATVGPKTEIKKVPITLRVETAAGANTIVYCKTSGRLSAGPSGAGETCGPGLVMNGQKPDGSPSCIDPNTLIYEDAGILSMTTPPTPGIVPMSCSYQQSNGVPSPTGNVEVSRPCDSKKFDCKFQNGKWQLVKKNGSTIDCHNGVSVDFPPEASTLIDANTYTPIDSSSTTNACLVNGDQERTCSSVIKEQLTGPVAKKTQSISITKPNGSTVSKNVNGLFFPVSSALGGGYFTTSKYTCAFTSGLSGGKWETFPTATKTTSEACTGGIISTPK